VIRVAFCALCLFAAACTPGSKEAAIQTGLNAGMEACDLLLADKSIPRDPEADAFCARMRNGCFEAMP
jgi:hypothetical protein